MFHRAIISAMAVSPEDIAAGTLALQVFVKNARNVEIIVGVAFAVIPTVLGIGAAGLLGSGIINTAKEIRNSVSLLKTFGTGILYGGAGLNVLREKFGGKLKQYNHPFPQFFGNLLTPIEWYKSRRKGGGNQDTQGKQEEQGGGGGGGNPPTPPDIKASDKKEEQAKINGIPIDEYIKKKQQ
jgi:energy-converting hydrogenase Eha subunit A